MKTHLLLFPLCLAACGGEMSTSQPLPADSECTRGAAESDLVVGAWAGPGALPDGGLAPAADVVVTTTFLALKPTESTSRLFNTLFADIRTDLSTREGLVAWRVGTSTRCVTARTLTVWENEAKMYDFVWGEAHGKAVSAIRDLSRGNSAVAQWHGPSTEANFETAFQRLGAVDARY